MCCWLITRVCLQSLFKKDMTEESADRFWILFLSLILWKTACGGYQTNTPRAFWIAQVESDSRWISDWEGTTRDHVSRPGQCKNWCLNSSSIRLMRFSVVARHFVTAKDPVDMLVEFSSQAATVQLGEIVDLMASTNWATTYPLVCTLLLNNNSGDDSVRPKLSVLTTKYQRWAASLTWGSRTLWEKNVCYRCGIWQYMSEDYFVKHWKNLELEGFWFLFGMDGVRSYWWAERIT